MSDGPVGVLTFHRCINNGSYWQARCLVDSLRARGLDAEILDHRATRIDILEWRCALRPTLPTPVPLDDRRRYREKVRAFARAIAALPMSAPFALEQSSGLDRYGTVVIGSDEVWNLEHPWYSGQTLFFGHGIEHSRRVAYAASVGSYDAERGLGEPWSGWLRRFDALSVRDDNTGAVVASSIGFAPALVADPCLEHPVAPEGAWLGPSHPFVAVYGHNFSPPFADAVRAWAGARRLPLLSIGYRNDWADEQWLTAGPHDFAHAMARASAVATNFFHGCVFALAQVTPFLAETTAYRTHKIRSLLGRLGGEDHLFRPGLGTDDVDRRLGQPPDDAVLSRLHALQVSSRRFLDDALALR